MYFAGAGQGGGPLKALQVGAAGHYFFRQVDDGSLDALVDMHQDVVVVEEGATEAYLHIPDSCPHDAFGHTVDHSH